MIIQGTAIKGMTVSSSAATVTADSYFNLVSLLLPGNGTNGAQNNTFLDSSTNNFTITRGGNATQGTFSPFSQTGWSNYFDGTGDKLSLSSSTAFGFGTGDFTIELWVFCSFNGAVQEFIDGRAVDDNIPWVLGINGTGLARTYDGTTIRASGQLNQNAWNHVAWVRASNVNTVYVNGVSVQTWTASQDFGSTKPLTIANNVGPTSEPFTGYISNLRIVKGTAVYTSTFTPSTTPLTAVSGTSLLTCQSNRFIDNSANAFAITVAGNTAVQAFSPFDPTAAYSAATVGGSGYFDGLGDYLTVPDNAALDGFGDFTIEFWVYFTDSTAQTILQKYSTSSGFSTYVFYQTGSNLLVYMSNGSSWIVNGAQAITGIVINQWYHIAVTRSGSSIQIFRNGAVVATATSSSALQSDTGILNIAQDNTSGNRFFGYLCDLRIVKGTAVYTSAFTPPTAPVTAVTNTSLLLSFTNGGITDAAAKNVLETVGSAQISTAQSKFGGSSMAFDGTGDYLKSILNDPIVFLGVGNWTIEGWVYLNTTSGTQTFIIGQSDYTNAANASYSLYVAGSSAGDFFYGSSFVSLGAPGLSATTWTHCAWVRNGSTITFYRNGTSITSLTIGTNSINNGTTNPRCIGGANNGLNQLNGYIDDLRVTRGLARYTANFTPPTAAFPTQ